MSEKIDLKTVAHIAELARLDPDPAESQQISIELSRIVDYISTLNEIDTTGIEPLHHVLDQHNIYDEDVPSASLPVESALSNAPAHSGNYFLVPRVVG